MRKYRLHARGVRAGGYDLLPRTLQAIADGHLDFTIDQQPYLQGFLPILQLFLARYSGGLVAPADTNTGLQLRHARATSALPDDDDAATRAARASTRVPGQLDAPIPHSA